MTSDKRQGAAEGWREDEPIIDWAALEARFDGSPGFVDQLIQTAIDSSGNGPAELRRLAESGDLGELYRRAHALKGMAGNLSAQPLYRLTDEVCTLARCGDRVALSRAGALAAAFEQLLEAMHDRLQEAG